MVQVSLLVIILIETDSGEVVAKRTVSNIQLEYWYIYPNGGGIYPDIGPKKKERKNADIERKKRIVNKRTQAIKHSRPYSGASQHLWN